MKLSLVAALGIALLSISAALAAARVSVEADAASPVAVRACNIDGPARQTTIYNRTQYTVRAFSERWVAYDAGGSALGAQTIDYTPSSPLASGATVGYEGTVPDAAFTSGSVSAIARFSCALVAATFGSGARWSPGQHWPGKLLSLTPSPASAPKPNAVGAAPGGMSFKVINAWNDFHPDGNFVHDTLLISGGDRDVTIKPSDFVLRVILANGGLGEYTGLTKAAPSFDRELPNPFATPSPLWVPEVDPNFDLGALGSVIVPAHGTVKVTVTFVLPEPLHNPTGNRDVVMP
jgi:hypothetical protein